MRHALGGAPGFLLGPPRRRLGRFGAAAGLGRRLVSLRHLVLRETCRLVPGALQLLLRHCDPAAAALRLALALSPLDGLAPLALLLVAGGLRGSRLRDGVELALGLRLGFLLRLPLRFAGGEVDHRGARELEAGEHLEAGGIEVAVEPAAAGLRFGGGAEGERLEVGGEPLARRLADRDAGRGEQGGAPAAQLLGELARRLEVGAQAGRAASGDRLLLAGARPLPRRQQGLHPLRLVLEEGIDRPGGRGGLGQHANLVGLLRPCRRFCRSAWRARCGRR